MSESVWFIQRRDTMEWRFGKHYWTKTPNPCGCFASGIAADKVLRRLIRQGIPAVAVEFVRKETNDS